MRFIGVAAEDAGAFRDVIGDDEVAALAEQFFPRVGDHVLRLGREADDEAGAFRGARDAGEYVGILDERERRRRRPLPLLDLLWRGFDPPVGHGRGADERIRREGALDGRKHLARAFDMDHVAAGRIGQGHRPGNERDSRARRRRRRRDGVALLARGTIGDVAHRIDGFMRRAGRDDHMPSCQRADDANRRQRQTRVALQRMLDRGHDLQRLAHAAGAIFAAGHLAVIRADEQRAILLQRRDIALRRGREPHAQIHGWREKRALVGREQQGRGEIVA